MTSYHDHSHTLACSVHPKPRPQSLESQFELVQWSKHPSIGHAYQLLLEHTY